MASESDILQALLRVLQPADAVVGPGDDAAVLALSGGLHVLTTDLLVEGVDFLRRYASPYDIGYKAAAVSLSDVAAMGGQPTCMTVAIGSPDSSLELFSELGRGLQAACGPAACSVVGGDLSRSPVLLLCTSVLGKVRGRPALRKGALPGDLILCTGSLGGAAAGLQALLSNVEGYDSLKERQLRPTARVEAGRRLVEQGLVSSMIDLSDGALQDLGHLCQQSGVQATLWLEQLPLPPYLRRFCQEQNLDPWRLALTGGEDFELLFTAPESKLFQIEEALASIIPVQVIGEIGATPPGLKDQERVHLVLEGQDFQESWLSRPGFDHFRDAAPHFDISMEAR